MQSMTRVFFQFLTSIGLFIHLDQDTVSVWKKSQNKTVDKQQT